VEETLHNGRLVRFGVFEVDLRSGELRKAGAKLKISGQPFQVLAILLENRGEIVTREDLLQRLWPDTFVDGDHNLNTAINKIREVLGDSAENPRFVETLPRRGYRFIAPLEDTRPAMPPNPVSTSRVPVVRSGVLRTGVLIGAVILIAAGSMFLYERHRVSHPAPQRSLTRLTFDEGLQIGATWSPDSRFIAYSSNRGGKFDIWVQQVSGGDPVQITKGPGTNWQPEWSPDGKYIAYRSENDDGGLFIVPALGGAGMERKIASFGFYPRWSPDSSQILFVTTQFGWLNRLYVVNLEGARPREVLKYEVLKHLITDPDCTPISAAWHPDGKRISFMVNDDPTPTFWTVPIDGGAAVRTQVPPELLNQIGEVSSQIGKIFRVFENEWAEDFKFSWAPSGRSIYFERTFRGAKNIWRMTVDPQTLRAISIDRVTTGPGLNTELSLSPDGNKIAFTDESAHVRAWLFPFDATRGRITGSGQPVTSTEVQAFEPRLSPDGKRLAFGGVRSGRWDLMESSVPDGREAPIVADDSYFRDYAVWSPDSRRLAYTRINKSTDKVQIMAWSSEGRKEEPITAPMDSAPKLFDWSRQNDSLLGSNNGASEIAAMPAAAAPHAEAAIRSVVSNPAYELYQCRYSPDGRWIVFEAIPRNYDGGAGAAVFVSPAAGGPWVRITDGKRWDDKPQWSPDGKVIYFVSARSGFFNVWGMRFDPAKGKTVGEPFPVTTLDNPSKMVPNYIPTVSLSLTQDRLVLTVAQVSGSIWVLDHVDRQGGRNE
jgi:Tol biopolymer transport system component/DNA-binding winged helix-turn-helix (wHTH) protein